MENGELVTGSLNINDSDDISAHFQGGNEE